MNIALVVFRRELRAFFDAPMAYVVAIGFLLLTTSLYMLDLWSTDQVSMRSFFEWVSWSACFIIPALTMRSWAEERRGATYELLLTFPTNTFSIVLGKFLATITFWAACLVGSLVLPIALKLLATPGLPPDWGAIGAGYFGSFLLGALLIALGLYLSSLCRDQVEAYIVTLVAVLALRLIGFAPIAGQVDSVVSGLGTFLRDEVSFSEPHARFVQGVVGLGDVLFHLAWVAGLLALNAVQVEESRMKPGAATRRMLAAAVGIPIIALAGSLALELRPRLDLTAEKLFTVSPAAVEVLQGIPEKDPVSVKLYFSPKDEMPVFMASLERDVTERLSALEREASGKLKVDVVHLHADDAILRAQEMLQAQLGGEDAKKKEEKKEGEKGVVEEKLLEEGILPFRVRSGGLTGTETKVVYAAMAVTHGAEKKEVIPQVMPGQLGALEQELITRVYRFTHDEKPVVGILAPIQSVDIDPQQMQLMQQLGLPMDQIAREQDDYRVVQGILHGGDRYDVRRLRPNDEQPLPDDMRTLIVLAPQHLAPRMDWEIQRLLRRGGTVIMAVQQFDQLVRPSRQGIGVQLRGNDTGVSDLLTRFGVDVPQKMVLNKESFPLSYQVSPFSPPVTIDFRWSFKLDAANFDRATALSNGIGGFVVIEAASPVTKDDAKLKELGLAWQPVLSTGEAAWTREVPTMEIPADLNEERPTEGPIALASLVRGTFPEPASPPPAWASGAPEQTPPPPVEAKPGALLLLGTANAFRDDQVQDQGGLNWAGALLRNAVDALSLGDVLLRLTVKEPVERPIRDVERSTRLVYEAAMIGLAPLVIAALGAVRMIARRRRQQSAFVPASAPAPAAARGAQGGAA
jgi:ABC-2 type transport system permease protein